MAGHSKWANIKHRKAGQDAKRGKLFTKLIKEVTVATQLAGPDDSSNPRLRTAVEKALAGNMTRDTINKAIKRASGNDDDKKLEEVIYEGYAPYGVAVLVYCLTDNRNRTVSDVRHGFTKFNGNLGTDGSVSYLFKKEGHIILAPIDNVDEVMELVIENGAEDFITNNDGSIEIRTLTDNLEHIKSILDKKDIKTELAEVSMLPENEIDLTEDQSTTVLKMIDHLEDLDDVQEVYSNAIFS